MGRDGGNGVAFWMGRFIWGDRLRVYGGSLLRIWGVLLSLNSGGDYPFCARREGFQDDVGEGFSAFCLPVV